MTRLTATAPAAPTRLGSFVPTRVLTLFLLLALFGCQGQAVPQVTSATPAPSAAPTSPRASDSSPTASTAPPPPTAAVAAPPTTAPFNQAIAKASPAVSIALAVSGDQARQDVDRLAGEIGSRVAGGPEQLRAADYLTRQLEAVGLATERQQFTFPAFTDRGSTLEVTGPRQLSPRTSTLYYSAGGEVEAELVDVGLARSGDFEPVAVRGKIALARRGEVRFGEKVETLAAAGARAVIIANNTSGLFAGSLGTGASLPAVAISADDGDALLGLIQAGRTTARIRVDADVQERAGYNVVGTKSGGPRTVVIGGHYDSVSAGPGANDNASGIATMLEVARVVAGRQYPFTIRFVGFDAEEIGLLGSRHYVGLLNEGQKRAVRAMINLDMVGVGDNLAFAGDSGLVDHAVDRAAAAGIGAGRLGGGGSSSDHASFQAAGIPTLFIHRREDPRYHTAGDQPEYVLPENLAVAGELVLEILDKLAKESP